MTNIYIIGDEFAPTARENVRFIAVPVADWNNELSPRFMKSIFKGAPDFGGGADAFLQKLIAQIENEIESTDRRMIAGYSMAGLFSLYAATKTGMFSGAASVSGSMWFEGILDDLRSAEHVPEKAYFSLGDKEKLGKNPYFKTIEDNTREAERILRGKGARTIFELNAGGHFVNPEGRVQKAVDWLLTEEI